MPNSTYVSPGDEILTTIVHTFSVPESVLMQTTPMETILTESLITPGLQTTVRVDSWIDNLPPKNLDTFKNATIGIQIDRAINSAWDAGTSLTVNQTVYRLGCYKKPDRPGTRKLMNNRIEEYTLHACDPTLLTDANTLVSDNWKCTPPSAIVAEMLACVGARAVDVEPSCCPRDYIARTIHPFQVINQQADAALIGGSPSFIHYMTYENGGTHHFRSLDSLCAQAPIAEYFFDETGISAGGYSYVYGVMNYNFPCDFDLLSDLLNGLGPSGVDSSAIMSFFPFLRQAGFGGTNPILGCAPGSTLLKAALATTEAQGGCPDYSQVFALKRQARMGLLEQDKLALNMVVPWNPDLHAGKVIKLTLVNKTDPSVLVYGSGTYLIHTMSHNIKYGGMAITTLDCVSTTVGGGTV